MARAALGAPAHVRRTVRRSRIGPEGPSPGSRGLGLGPGARGRPAAPPGPQGPPPPPPPSAPSSCAQARPASRAGVIDSSPPPGPGPRRNFEAAAAASPIEGGEDPRSMSGRSAAPRVARTQGTAAFAGPRRLADLDQQRLPSLVSDPLVVRASSSISLRTLHLPHRSMEVDRVSHT
jgi:hypothetical protein